MRAAGPLRRGLMAGLLALAGCGGEGDPPAAGMAEHPTDGPPARRMAAIRWEPVFRVGGGPRDTLLFEVTRMDADETGVTVVDRHGGRVLRFGRSGRLLWSFGRPGEGPAEFRHPRDLHVDPAGRTWVLDVRNARLTVITPDGTLAFLVPLDDLGFLPDRFVPVPGDRAVLLDPGGDRPLVRVDRRGRVVRRSALPWAGAGELDPLAAQMLLEGAGTAGGWAAAFVFGDRLLLFDAAGEPVGTGWFPEPVAFPEVQVRRSGSVLGRRGVARKVVAPTFAAVSLTSSRDRLYVHFAGRSERAYRLLDSYAVDGGGYVETFRLPRPVAEVAWGDGILYVSYADPYPTLAAWRPRPDRLP